MNNSQGTAIYSKMSNENSVASANRHELINLLLSGAGDNIAKAIQKIQEDNTEAKCQYLSKAFNIIDGLRLALDIEKGGEIATNLDQLYEYMQNQIIDANLKNTREPLDEVKSLLKTIQSGWQGISEFAS